MITAVLTFSGRESRICGRI